MFHHFISMYHNVSYQSGGALAKSHWIPGDWEGRPGVHGVHSSCWHRLSQISSPSIPSISIHDHPCKCRLVLAYLIGTALPPHKVTGPTCQQCLSSSRRAARPRPRWSLTALGQRTSWLSPPWYQSQASCSIIVIQKWFVWSRFFSYSKATKTWHGKALTFPHLIASSKSWGSSLKWTAF